MSKQWIRCLMAGAMLALSVGNAQAAVVYDSINVTPLNPVVNADSATSLWYNAQQFHTSVPVDQPNWQLNSITLDLLKWQSYDLITGDPLFVGNPVVQIYADVPGNPGSLGLGTDGFYGAVGAPLATFTAFNALNPVNQDTYTEAQVLAALTSVTFTNLVNPTVLAANTDYWVVLSATGTGEFGWANVQQFDSVNPNLQVMQFTASTIWQSATNSFSGGIPVLDGTGLPAQSVNNDFPYVMAMDASAVPEPSTYVLLMISLGVVGYARKRMTTKE